MDSRDFDFQRVAQGYKKRPFLHKQVIERFRKEVSGQTFSHGLDVGCGAGLSSKALKLICSHVTGADISPEMIRVAGEVCEDAQGYDFIVSKAEEIPAAAEKYDIVTAAGVIQWVEREDFLQNLRNIMKEQGYVLIYDFCISDRMKGAGNTEYAAWWSEHYLKEFPKPYRNEHVWTKEEVEPCGFSMLRQVQYEMEYVFDMHSFIEFMMIQSNVNVKIEKGKWDAGEVREWFVQSLGPVFKGEKQTLMFTGYSWCLMRSGNP
jgi:Methylase involved in ubiquinone/menaquinone biosynthesis